MLRHTPLSQRLCEPKNVIIVMLLHGCDANDMMMMTMTMDANLCKYDENLLANLRGQRFAGTSTSLHRRSPIMTLAVMLMMMMMMKITIEAKKYCLCLLIKQSSL